VGSTWPEAASTAGLADSTVVAAAASTVAEVASFTADQNA
jgi:hypothetical protein